jgi:cell division protein FtsB
VSRRALGVGAVVAVALGLGVFAATGYLRVVHLRNEIRAFEEDLTSLRARSDELARGIECLRSDPACIEKSAREELGMVRRGETVLKFPARPPR